MPTLESAPEQTIKSWSPASVLLPDGTQHHRAAVYLTTVALRVYTQPDTDPTFSSPVDFTRTARPRRDTLHVGIDVHTDGGLVVVTPTGGACTGCAAGKLSSWRPPFAGSVVAWPSR